MRRLKSIPFNCVVSSLDIVIVRKKGSHQAQ